MIKIFFKKYYLLILIIIINISVHWIWFFNLQYLTYGDSGIYLFETQKELIKNSTQIYESGINFGQLSLNAGYKIIEFFQGGFAQFGVSYIFSFRIIFLWLYVFFSPIAAYFLFSKFIKSKIGVFIATLIYLYNTYILLIQSGQFLILLGSVFLTFSLLFAYKFYIENYSIKNYSGLLLFLFLLSSYEFRIFYIGTFIIGLFVLYKFIFIKKCFRDLWSFTGAVLLTISLNLYWLFPLLFENKISNNELFSRGLFGNQYFDISSSLTLFHRFWTGGLPSIFINQPIPLYFWLIPIFAILSLMPKKKNQFLLYFALLALIGIFLTKQSGEPFPNIYSWLYQKIPGFNTFREASKFYILTVLGYSVLIGSFFSWLWESWNKQKWQIFGKYFLTFFIITIFLWNTKPLITREMKTMFIPRYIPQDYLVLEDFISKQPKYFRTIWTPTYSRWSIYLNDKPEISDISIIQSEWKDFINYNNHDNSWPMQDQITDIYSKGFSNQLFDASSIKYVIVPLQDKANDDDFFVYYGGDKDPNIRQWYINQLDKVNWLKKIDIGTKDLVVYENENFRPHLYLTKELETIYKNLSFTAINWQLKNPTEYVIKLNNISQPVFLNFSEAYHPDWKLRVGNFNWFTVLLNKNYFIPDSNHFKNDATLNSFYLDPAQICSGNKCERNSDGSYNLELTLYFKPQSYFYLGLIISGTTLVGCLGYLGWDWVRRKKKKEKGEIEEGGEGKNI